MSVKDFSPQIVPELPLSAKKLYRHKEKSTITMVLQQRDGGQNHPVFLYTTLVAKFTFPPDLQAFLAEHTGIFSDLEASCREGISRIIQAPSLPQAGTGMISFGARPGLIHQHVIQGQSMPRVISPAGKSPSPGVPAARSSN